IDAVRGLRCAGETERADALEEAMVRSSPVQHQDAYLAAAKTKYEEEGRIEIDDQAVVSLAGDETGAYVMAWVFVYNDDAGIEPGPRLDPARSHEYFEMLRELVEATRAGEDWDDLVEEAEELL